MKEMTLETYVEEHKQWFLEEFGKLDYRWYNEGLYYTIASYANMRREFSDADIEFLHRTEFEPEDFLKDIEEND